MFTRYAFESVHPVRGYACLQFLVSCAGVIGGQVYEAQGIYTGWSETSLKIYAPTDTFSLLDLPLFVYSVREKSRKDYRVSLTRRGGDRVKFHERLSSSRLVSTFVLEFLFPLPSLARETSAPFFETVTAHTDSPLTSGERPTDTPDQRTE